MGAPDDPFVVLLEQDRSDEANDGVFVREDADHLGPPLDLAVEALDRVGGSLVLAKTYLPRTPACFNP